MEWLSKNGGDTVDVLMKIAQHGGLTAGQLNDLTGKIGNALIPAMQELSKVGVQANTDFDALTKQINETKDRIEILDRQMNVLAMQGGKTFLETVAAMKQGLVDLTGWFLRTAEANATMWQRLGKASDEGLAVGRSDQGRDERARTKQLEAVKKQQDDFKAIVAGQVKIEQAVRNAPTPYAGSINPPKPPKPKKAATRRRQAARIRRHDHRQGDHPDRRPAVLSGASAEASPFPGPRGVRGSRRRHREAQQRLHGVAAARMAAGVRPADRADRAGPRRGDQGARRARAVRGTARAGGGADPADRQPEHRHRGRRLVETTDKTTEATYKLSDTFQGFGQVASSAFEDAIVKGGKFSDMLNGLAEDIQRLLIRNTLNKFLDIAINAGGAALTGWLAAAAPTPASRRPPTGAASRASAAMCRQLLRLRHVIPHQRPPSGPASRRHRNALGNAFDHGNVIPFARGGVVSRPTIFPMARGMGLMGEAGPEAVVPLKRMPSGNLGVEGSAGGVTVNIINNTPSKVTTEEKEGDPKGGINLNVVIDSLETAMAQRLQRPGSQLNRAMAQAANPIKAR